MKRKIDIVIRGILLIFALKASHALPKYFTYSELIIPAGLYIIFYNVLYFIFQKWVGPRIFHHDTLEGNWVYTVKSKTDKLSVYGSFKINESLYDIKIVNGNSWYYGSNPELCSRRGVWKSNAAFFENNELWVLYLMHIFRESNNNGNTKNKNILPADYYPGSIQSLFGGVNHKKLAGQKHLSGTLSGVGPTMTFDRGLVFYAINAKEFTKKLDTQDIPKYIYKGAGEEVRRLCKDRRAGERRGCIIEVKNSSNDRIKLKERRIADELKGDRRKGARRNEAV